MTAAIHGLEGAKIFGEWDLLIAVALVVLLPLALPREKRYYVRLPLCFLMLHLICMGLLWAMAEDAPVHKGIAIVASLFLFCSIGRSVFLLVVHLLMAGMGFRPAKIFLDLAMGLIYIFILQAVLVVVAGLEVRELVAGSALVTAVLGFALKDTLGNLFAGLAIHVQQPFEVDDWIQFDDRLDHIGKVKEINWRATTVVTLDQVDVVIPNSKLAEAPIRNFTKPFGWSRRSIYFVAPYSVPTRKVHQIVLESIPGSWGVLETPAPSIVTNAFTERGVEYWVRIFTREFDFRDKVDGGVRDRIWYGLTRCGVIIPPPQRHITVEDDSLERRAQNEKLSAEARGQVLRRVDLFRGLPDAAFTRLASLSRTQFFHDGETILRQGEPGEELFILFRGKAAIRHQKPGGGSQFDVASLGPGDVLGEMALLTGAKRTATAKAVGECELLVVDKSAFRQLLHEFPDLARVVSETIAQRSANLGEAADAHEPTDHGDATASESLLLKIKEYFGL